MIKEGLYLSRRIWSSSPAPPPPPPPPQTCTDENKIIGLRIFAQDIAPRALELPSRPSRGLAEDFSQIAIVNKISGGRPTLHGKTGISSRKTPGPRKTLKESGVSDR
ncbi:hypothetical protein CDAR_205501 [Caerostris darwini]|uniref:Uncharacterized protein n=1 Tax=Caerostris darwini TaxID=1538125 RepID=A0AAV4WV06_9ARAC|nr:hypothetical protein CDAR_205501 [Caerostris darwini]